MAEFAALAFTALRTGWGKLAIGWTQTVTQRGWGIGCLKVVQN